MRLLNGSRIEKYDSIGSALMARHYALTSLAVIPNRYRALLVSRTEISFSSAFDL
jgi:hypothetical protein